MSTIKISELATSNISLSDFFAKADANGLATKNNIQGLANALDVASSSQFRGSLAIADTPALDGWYFATESGTYTNAGGLVVDVSDNIVIIIVSDTQTVFSKVDIPVTLTIDATPTAGSTNAVQSGGVADADKVIQDKLDLTDANLADIGTQTNLIKTVNLVDEQGIYSNGDIGGLAGFFYSKPQPITESLRYSMVSSNSGITPFFAFYNSENPSSATLVGSRTQAKEATAPVGATHLVFSTLITEKDSCIVMQLDSGFPTLGQNTIEYTNLYTKTEVDTIISDEVGLLEDKDNLQDIEIAKKVNTSDFETELDYIKIYGTTVGRFYNDGTLAPGETTYFMTPPIPTTELDRFATVSDNIGIIGTFGFYTSETANAGTFVSKTQSRDAVTPATATHFIFYNLNTQLASLILMKLASGFPTLGQNTTEYPLFYKKTETYNKTEIDTQLNLFTSEFCRYIFTSAICIGDSITQGWRSVPPNLFPNESYPTYLSKITGWTVENAGQAGITTIGWWDTKFPTYDFSLYDFFPIFLGQNGGLTDTLAADTASGNYLTYADTNTGSYCKIIEGIKVQRPDAVFILMKRYDDTTNGWNVVDQIGAKYNIPVISWSQNGFIDLFEPAYHPHSDNVHFGSIGNLAIAQVFFKSISKYIYENQSLFSTYKE